MDLISRIYISKENMTLILCIKENIDDRMKADVSDNNNVDLSGIFQIIIN